jgi:hypothetical protein
MNGFLFYYVARHAAADLDREGRQPGPVLLLLTGIASAATFGLMACVAIPIGWTALALLGLVH